MPEQRIEPLKHDLIGGGCDTTVLEGLRQLGLSIDAACFGLRCVDLAAQWQSMVAGLVIAFVASYLSLPIPSQPVWLALHRELRSSLRLRSVHDFLAAELPARL